MTAQTLGAPSEALADSDERVHNEVDSASGKPEAE